MVVALGVHKPAPVHRLTQGRFLKPSPFKVLRRSHPLRFWPLAFRASNHPPSHPLRHRPNNTPWILASWMANIYPPETTSGVVTSYIPLTDVFVPPESCKSVFREGASWIAYDLLYGLEINSNVVCQPSAVTTWWTQATSGSPLSGQTIVSIGPLSCPSSWNTVATSLKDVSSTAAMCCPS